MQHCWKLSWSWNSPAWSRPRWLQTHSQSLAYSKLEICEKLGLDKTTHSSDHCYYRLWPEWSRRKLQSTTQWWYRGGYLQYIPLASGWNRQCEFLHYLHCIHLPRRSLLHRHHPSTWELAFRSNECIRRSLRRMRSSLPPNDPHLDWQMPEIATVYTFEPFRLTSR